MATMPRVHRPVSRKARSSRPPRPRTRRELYEWRLNEALSLFASRLSAAASEFNDRVQFMLSGVETVRGNDGVVLGTRKHGH